MRLARIVTEAVALNEESLDTVDLSCGSARGIHDDGAIALATALSKNTVVTSVDLGGNFIGFDGVVALSQALHINRTIANLELRQNSICSRGCARLVAAISNNTSIRYR